MRQYVCHAGAAHTLKFITPFTLMADGKSAKWRRSSKHGSVANFSFQSFNY
jgi:hypothetical protein